MSPRLRRLVLATHVVASVGWIGATVAFLALAVTALDHPATCTAMAVVARCAIVPMCVTAVVTGIAQGLGSPWGLFRHYWVTIKLAITAIATVILFAHLGPIDRLASGAVERGMQIQMVVAPAAAIAALIVTTVLGIYKPRGRYR